MLDLLENTTPFKKLGAQLIPDPFPGCERMKFRSRKYWECYVRHTLAGTYHLVGSCRMGSGILDANSVVDSNLRLTGFVLK